MGVACQEASQAPEQGLTLDHTGRLHCNQEREAIEGGILLWNQARLCLSLFAWNSPLGSQGQGPRGRVLLFNGARKGSDPLVLANMASPA